MGYRREVCGGRGQGARRQAEQEGLTLEVSDNQAGFRGVKPNHKRFQAQITIDGQDQYLGTFDTAEEAALAWIQDHQDIDLNALLESV